MIYAAENFSGAMLEVLVHANLGRIPRTHSVVRIEIPDGLLETVETSAVPGWAESNLLASRRFGDLWLRQVRSAALLVPGMATGGREHTVLMNPRHPDFPRIGTSAPEPIRWDARLFAR